MSGRFHSSLCAYCRMFSGQTKCLCPDVNVSQECTICGKVEPAGTYCHDLVYMLKQAAVDEFPGILREVSTCHLCFQPWLSAAQVTHCCALPSLNQSGRLICPICQKDYAKQHLLRGHVMNAHFGRLHHMTCHDCWRFFPQTELGCTLLELHRTFFHKNITPA